MKVYDGAGLIADKSDAMVVPVRITGLDQTPFSRLSRAQVRHRWFPKVTVTVLEPVKLSVAPNLKGKYRRQAAGAALDAIMSDLVFRTTSTDRTVVEAVIQAAKIHGSGWVAVEDSVTGVLSYRRLLLGAAILGRKLMPYAAEGKSVGVMLPNANGAAVTLVGLMSAGRVPAMINYTAGPTSILASCRAASVTTIVTSRAFVEKGNIGPLVDQLARTVHMIYLEDVRKTIGLAETLRGLIEARKPLVQRDPDDPAAILFTSGSEGTPKGVVLSHRNMLANAAQAAARIDFGRTDKVFNVLPVFHSYPAAGVGRARVSLSLAIALPHGARARIRRERNDHVRHRHVFGGLRPDRARLRFSFAALHPGRSRANQGIDPPDLLGEIRLAHLWKATV
jgi:acyl-[acyl-carrier-protein]-phospholipid O-acyltransferase/long-chain-fatty-acid--[acyl-carrier-protein] ligase